MKQEPSDGVRLQKALAQAGVASRRASEELIAAGRVEVNGKVVTEQGMRVDPERDTIRVDGSRIPPPRRHLYLVLNKPRGVVSTMDDPDGRPTLEQYVPRRQRLFHAGQPMTTHQAADASAVQREDAPHLHRILRRSDPA